MYRCFMIEIAALRALVAVDQHGSVIAAADIMGFSPSAVSQQIKKLERQSGVTVLERHGRGVLLTDRGMALAEYGDGGPGLDIRVLAEDPREAVQRVASGEADLGVVHNWNSVPLLIPGNMVHEKLCTDTADVLLNSAHPLAGRSAVEASDLLGESWISTPANAICNEALLAIFAGLGQVPDIRMYDPDFSTHIAMVRQGVAVALVPRLGRPELPRGVVAVPVENPRQQREVGLVYRKTMQSSPSIRHVVGLLREAAAELDGM
jgi:DNA-binding transcriptional LysR family regulator